MLLDTVPSMACVCVLGTSYSITTWMCLKLIPLIQLKWVICQSGVWRAKHMLPLTRSHQCWKIVLLYYLVFTFHFLLFIVVLGLNKTSDIYRLRNCLGGLPLVKQRQCAEGNVNEHVR